MFSWVFKFVIQIIGIASMSMQAGSPGSPPSLLSLPENVLLDLLDVSFEEPQPFMVSHPVSQIFSMWACLENDLVYTLSTVCKVFRDLTFPLRFRVLFCPTYDVWLRFLRLADESPEIARHVRYLATSLMRLTVASDSDSNAVPFSVNGTRPVHLMSPI